LKIVVGLGNPGREYEATRHNAGVRALLGAAELLDVALAPGPGPFWSGRARVAGEAAVLARPTTYMNESGRAVAALAEQHDEAPESFLVLVDDVHLPLGRIRLRTSGGDGGHNGLASIIAHLGTEGFARLRIGVGPPPEPAELKRFVLEPFEPEAEAEASAQEERAARAAVTWLREGAEAAMQAYNG
jgi:PTH1 family peptidyl-tRNA hydrolase